MNCIYTQRDVNNTYNGAKHHKTGPDSSCWPGYVVGLATCLQVENIVVVNRHCLSFSGSNGSNAGVVVILFIYSPVCFLLARLLVCFLSIFKADIYFFGAREAFQSYHYFVLLSQTR